jgi:hypothetical protein
MDDKWIDEARDATLIWAYSTGPLDIRASKMRFDNENYGVIIIDTWKDGKESSRT